MKNHNEVHTNKFLEKNFNLNFFTPPLLLELKIFKVLKISFQKKEAKNFQVLK